MGDKDTVRDVDRELTIAQVRVACADGVLSEAERDLRVLHARSARTPAELAGLTQGLSPDRARHTVSRSVRYSASLPRHGSRPVGCLLALAVVGIVAASIFLVRGADESTSSGKASAGSVESAAAAEPTGPGESRPSEPAVWRLTVASLQQFRADYRARFGTTQVYDVMFRDAGDHTGYVRVEVPSGDGHRRSQTWEYTGTFTSQGDLRATTAEGTVDLAAINFGAMVRNVQVAEKTLQVPDGTLAHVSLSNFGDGRNRLGVYVTNQYSESGYLATTLGGRIVDRHAFDG